MFHGILFLNVKDTFKYFSLDVQRYIPFIRKITLSVVNFSTNSFQTWPVRDELYIHRSLLNKNLDNTPLLSNL